MKDYKKPLDFSYPRIDLDSYVRNFIANRENNLAKNNFEYKEDDNKISIIEHLNSYPIQNRNRSKNEIYVKDDLIKWLISFYENSLALNDLTTIHKLQKKFELFQRIFTIYDFKYNRVNDLYKDLGVYALLSIALTELFLHTRNSNYFNSAIKLNDYISLYMNEVMKSDYYFVQKAFNNEKLTIEILNEVN